MVGVYRPLGLNNGARFPHSPLTFRKWFERCPWPTYRGEGGVGGLLFFRRRLLFFCVTQIYLFCLLDIFFAILSLFFKTIFSFFSTLFFSTLLLLRFLLDLFVFGFIFFGFILTIRHILCGGRWFRLACECA